MVLSAAVHAKELAKLVHKLYGEKLRQEEAVKERLAKQRQQKLLEAKKRQVCPPQSTTVPHYVIALHLVSLHKPYCIQ